MEKVSTEILYSDDSGFYGEYKKYRKAMDYKYYKNYKKERQELQDAIINKIIEGAKRSNSPWLIYTMGCYGSGKTHTLRNMKKLGSIDLNEFIHIDPDKIKEMLPDIKELTKLYPNDVSALLHKESTFIANLVEYICIDKNVPIIVDGSLHDYEWYTNHIAYKIGIIKVECDLDILIDRCNIRGKITGRYISIDTIKKIYDKIPLSFEELKEFVDFYLIIDNNKEPTIVKFKFNNIYSINIPSKIY